jgi:hypothetical protein
VPQVGDVTFLVGFVAAGAMYAALKIPKRALR